MAALFHSIAHLLVMCEECGKHYHYSRIRVVAGFSFCNKCLIKLGLTSIDEVARSDKG